MDDEKFVYVFSDSARDSLIKSGYELIKSDERNNVYVFENNTKLSFALKGLSTIKSNTLSF